MVPQIGAVSQVPPSPAVLVTPVVALAWEVDPLGVSELVVHKTQVSLTPQAEGHKSNHLVQCHPPEDPWGFFPE